MIVFTRALAREFRLLLGRCVSGRTREPAPPVVVQVRDGVRTLAATAREGVILIHTSPASGEKNGRLVLPAALLASVEGATDEPVSVEPQTKLHATVRWSGRDGPHSTTSELILPGRHHEVPEPPPLSAVGPEFLTALNECGRTSARDSGRYALSKIQVQGKAGRVIGTDATCALLWNGFRLPFPDQFLIPAIGVFGSRELTREVDVRVGLKATHLVVAAGPWAVWLPVDVKSRYPDVASIIPRTDSATVAGIDERDAEVLLRELQKLPRTDEEYCSVTLDLDGGVKVRARDATGAVREIFLARSPVAGPAVRVALDRAVLRRILTLGCHTIRLVDGKPVVAEGASRTVLAATLDNSAVIPPAKNTVRTSTEDEAIAIPNLKHEGKTPMKPTSNGQVPPQPSDPTDPLVVAEELRAALVEVAAKATRLVAALRAGRKEKKALATVLAGLKELNLGTPEK